MLFAELFKDCFPDRKLRYYHEHPSETPRSQIMNYNFYNKHKGQGQTKYELILRDISNQNKINNQMGSVSKLGDWESKKSDENEKSPIKRVPFYNEIQVGVLEQRSIYMVNVSYVESKKRYICWVQTVCSLEDLNAMTQNFFQEQFDLKPLEQVAVGQGVLSFYDDAWRRAEVVGKNPLLVHYFDYGNRNKPSYLKPLPPPTAFNRQAAFAIRAVIKGVNKKRLKPGLSLTVQVQDMMDEDTVVLNTITVHKKSAEKNNASKEIKSEIPPQRAVKVSPRAWFVGLTN